MLEDVEKSIKKMRHFTTPTGWFLCSKIKARVDIQDANMELNVPFQVLLYQQFKIAIKSVSGDMTIDLCQSCTPRDHFFHIKSISPIID